MQQISDSDSDSESINSYSGENGHYNSFSITYLPHSTILHRDWQPYRLGDCSLSLYIPHIKILNACTKDGMEITPIKRGFPYIINGYKVWIRAIYTEYDDGEKKYSLQVLMYYNGIGYGWASARSLRTDLEILTVFTGKTGWRQLDSIKDRLP